jgi:hypothetical protein
MTNPFHREDEEEKHRASDSAIEEQVDATIEHGDIAQHAYHLWHQRGCPEGCPDDDWYRAEQELASRHSSGDGQGALPVE